jgi:hypothetical protein
MPYEHNRSMNIDLEFETTISQPSIGSNTISLFDVPFKTPAASNTHETSIVASINSNSNNAEYLTTLLNKEYTKPMNKLLKKEKARLLSISLLPKVCISHEASLDFKFYKSKYRNTRRLRDVTFNSSGTTLKVIVDMITDKILCDTVHDVICEIDSILNDYTEIFLNKI